jgi:hypothetical protein
MQTPTKQENWYAVQEWRHESDRVRLFKSQKTSFASIPWHMYFANSKKWEATDRDESDSEWLRQ